MSPPPAEEVNAALRRFWGYDAFRPMQESIVRSILTGRDVCVVMPTGGGKSLCYQLPAAMQSGRTAVVISPLIALMQDQVAQLTQMGIPATRLDSSVDPGEQARLQRRALAGEFRLLYLSPERLARHDTASWLRRAPLSLFAIDEAHCISEWGHEFRPEYRQLRSLRQNFPGLPIAAFTASATRRVRHDILDQLELHDPAKYIASFHRANLRYIARACKGAEQTALLDRALAHHRGSNVIVYAPTIVAVEQTVDRLQARGIAAVAYHGKMDSDARRRNQERWMAEEVRVLVGTVAFGLGINKAAVRAVIHLSLPKSIEQYYQEAGRAGRDGEPADCLLLWQKRDAGLLAHFIEMVEDEAERQRGWQRYREIRNFVEAPLCRHRQICLHFGERPAWATCGACDVCVAETAALAGPALEAAKAPRKPGKAKPAASPPAQAAATPDHATPEPELRAHLRAWRRDTAREHQIAAFIVMHDSSLDALCRRPPHSLDELLAISGFGERKVALYGESLLEAVRRFEQGERAQAAGEAAISPAGETLRLLAEGKTFDEIALLRGRQRTTVVAMVADLVETGEAAWNPAWVEPDVLEGVRAAAAQQGLDRVKPLSLALPQVDFGVLRLAVAHLRHQARSGPGRSPTSPDRR